MTSVSLSEVGIVVSFSLLQPVMETINNMLMQIIRGNLCKLAFLGDIQPVFFLVDD